MDDRYSRQILFSKIGREGQGRLKNKHVLLVGAGALGSANAEMLVRAGVGEISIVDRDYVEESNLQRQQLYTEQDVLNRLPKAEAARKHLLEINREAKITPYIMDGDAVSLESLVKSVDLIIDATDNFETRMILNDLSQKWEVPWIYGACVGSVGMTFTIIPGVTPCLHCMLNTIPVQGMTCDTGGIIGPAVQMVVAHQTSEALKLLVGDIESVRNTFVSFDLWNNHFHHVKVSKVKKASCLSCGEHPEYPFLKGENTTKTTILCGRETIQIRPPQSLHLDLQKLKESALQMGARAKANPFLVSIEFENHQRMVVFPDGRALIHGTKNMVHAKALYQKMMG
ncbi:ThiF family adenylyltransferase [Peribacillus alkalitolerans]|uniref:ThiF family adenylyltransferase n=1 Tax=Peribacillus alkalitolerans TaxID=1550385 RepID=UPI0013D8CE15|nr:ThiF family adenylyltransferase [Peribacillus alkalitolerans]